ncbi:threonine ammonia-lyase [Aestuariispira insulae]|uniref:Threonine dehydratase n=1 Tax=Aestuariispira insulae TaxID=1461337 RepID=A0A3D9HXK3_9PROT|nr:threonine/serine dehydratase [Aestuariispira insulae]RED54224.1 threonine dehydratase [Aestuariispira insulae]
MTDRQGPSIQAIRDAAEQLRGRIIETPVTMLASDRIKPYLPESAEVSIKLELFQHAGSFKARGALLNVSALTDEERKRGVTTVSAGNHALALSWAAAQEKVHAKVVMPEASDPVRVEGCRKMGAEVILTRDVHAAFAEMERIRDDEGRTVVHPFEGPRTTLGTATCGLEFATAVPDLDAVIIPVGGGGLISGMACAFRQMNPNIEIIGVEPFGADSMYRSFETGQPEKLEKVHTIADSLGSPLAMPYSFAVTKDNVDRIIRVEDDSLRKYMALLFDALKIAVEPAGAASTAALGTVLREEMRGRKVGVIACGSNISEEKFGKLAGEGRALF